MRPDGRALDRGQDIAPDEVLLALHDDRQGSAAEARALGGAAVVHDLDEVARGERQPEQRRGVGVDLTTLKPEPWARDPARLAQGAKDRFGGVDRQREAD